MFTLFKSLVMYRLDYLSQLWSPYLLKPVYLTDKVQIYHSNALPFLHLTFRAIKTLLITDKERERGIAPMLVQRFTLQWPMDGIQRWTSVVLTAMMAKHCYNVVNHVFPSITPCCKHK